MLLRAKIWVEYRLPESGARQRPDMSAKIGWKPAAHTPINFELELLIQSPCGIHTVYYPRCMWRFPWVIGKFSLSLVAKYIRLQLSACQVIALRECSHVHQVERCSRSLSSNRWVLYGWVPQKIFSMNTCQGRSFFRRKFHCHSLGSQVSDRHCLPGSVSTRRWSMSGWCLLKFKHRRLLEQLSSVRFRTSPNGP